MVYLLHPRSFAKSKPSRKILKTSVGYPNYFTSWVTLLASVDLIANESFTNKIIRNATIASNNLESDQAPDLGPNYLLSLSAK